jgi:hypothetical protein
MNSTAFSVHSDSAPTFYINGNPAPTDASTRTLEHDVAALIVGNPITLASDTLSAFLADRAVMNLLHMVTFVPDRTPSFTMFGNPDYFNQTSQTSGNPMVCPTADACVFETPGFAWNHGDVQSDITTTWFGMAGPGVSSVGRDDSVFSDHTDIRPTILALLGLSDDYVSDGRVLMEFVAPNLVPDRHQYISLAQVYKQITAPVGKLGLSSLTYANRSITSNDTIYNNYLTTIANITSTRNNLAAQMISLLNGAAFSRRPIQPQQANNLISQGNQLISNVQSLAGP